MIVRTLLAVLAMCLAFGESTAAEPKVEIVQRSDVVLIPLNPARGDASPKAGVLWGDIRKDVPSGALIQFADGFASPPHIHNTTYRAVVIEGTVHNDDPEAADMWMGPGSFWTQPAGEVHITSVGPGGGTAFLEIQSGPYLVQPPVDAFDNGERPVNIDSRNIVWLDATDVTWLRQGPDAGGPQLAFLWGEPGDGRPNGTFLKLPAGYSGDLIAGGRDLKAVVVRGVVARAEDSLASGSQLEPGSYLGSSGTVSHPLSCVSPDECVLYIWTRGTYQLATPK